MPTTEDKIKELEAEYARTQKNKQTEGHLGLIKAKLAKLRRELEDQGSKSGGGGGFNMEASAFNFSAQEFVPLGKMAKTTE